MNRKGGGEQPKGVLRGIDAASKKRKGGGVLLDVRNFQAGSRCDHKIWALYPIRKSAGEN